VREASNRALEAGAVKKISATGASFFRDRTDDVNMSFLLTKVDLAKKKNKKKKRGFFNPFAKKNLEAALVVGDVSPTHSLILNKFNLVSHHAIVITKEFERQESALTVEDFDAFWNCVVNLEALGFYNCGPHSGASQPHKHMQLIPLASLHESADQSNSMGQALPTPLVEEPLYAHLLANTITTGEPFVADGLLFDHAVAYLGTNAHEVVGDASITKESLYAIYQQLLVELQLPSAPHVNGNESSYNVLLWDKWMMVVPRTDKQFGDVFVNSVGFAGYLLLKDRSAHSTIERLGAMAVLRKVGRAKPQRNGPQQQSEL
jgi:ATP adenylyltransferase